MTENPNLAITATPVEALPYVWDIAAKLLVKSAETSKQKFEVTDLYEPLTTGKLMLWLVLDGDTPIAAVTTRIIVYPQRLAMALDWVGGTRMSEWLPLALKTFAAHAARNGCAHMEGYGRKAWGRLLADYGWKPEYIAYRLELDNG